MGFYWSYTLLL